LYQFGSINEEEGIMATADKVGNTTFTTPSPTTIVAVRDFAAPRDRIWEMFTKPEHVRQWMLGPDGWSMPVCEIDLRIGGEWRWVWRNDEGEEFGMTGVYKEIIPNERLVNTESWGAEWPETISTLVLSDQDGLTRATSTLHYPSQEARDAALATGMKEGWAQSNDRLDAYVPRAY
jgi:uncharacterized protein YndB with AHSA1/START domain